jgi:hypothetical protein
MNLIFFMFFYFGRPGGLSVSRPFRQSGSGLFTSIPGATSPQVQQLRLGAVNKSKRYITRFSSGVLNFV